ncbi:MAG: amino acid ABC transporter permease [Holosporaceae bacterium]|jgi:polar amino acid transport system permease protein|nr:amino acid ABC transporter permease [Holosporaceae bacterium]
MEKALYNFLFIGRGLAITLQLLAGGFLIGVTIGTALAALRYNKICSPIIKGFVSLVRGTPLLLQLSLIYFSVPTLFGVKLSVLAAGVIAFGINSSAYVSEILRSGIESLPKGQFEAARTLGIPKYYMWKDIILPQAIANVLPALVNELIDLLKETALIATIGGMDVMRRSQVIAAEQFEYFIPLCMAGVYYYVLVLFIESIIRRIEKKKSYA